MVQNVGALPWTEPGRLVYCLAGVAPGIFRRGADSSDEGAAVWFLGGQPPPRKVGARETLKSATKIATLEGSFETASSIALSIWKDISLHPEARFPNL